jgi:hypothetical protein
MLITKALPAGLELQLVAVGPLLAEVAVGADQDLGAVFRVAGR